MGQEINLLDTYPKAERDYDARARGKTPEVVRIAKQFDKEFFDGERRHGYGGYKYDGRWKTIVKRMRDYYQLPDNAAYSLDVIEHIPPESEDRFMANICNSLRPDAVCIIGTPNVEAQKYATPASAEGHVNLKSAESLMELLSRYFHNVFTHLYER